MTTKTLLSVALLTLLSGCESVTDSPLKSASSSSAGPTAFDRVTKGMTAAEVRRIVGEPLQTKPFPSGGTNCAVWVYRYKVSETVVQVPISTQELPRMNPITGQMGTVQESIMANEHTVVNETVEMLVLDDRLIELKRKQTTDRSIVN